MVRVRNPDKCAYGNPGKNGSCLTSAAMLKAIDTWNELHPDDMVKRSITSWKELARRFQDSCNSDRCALRAALGRRAEPLESTIFAPLPPKSWDDNPETWLNSTDISRVMGQVESFFQEFLFLGPFPIDFASRARESSCVSPPLCRFTVSSLFKRGKSKLGVILNLDKHYQPGSHWVALWFHPAAGEIVYFDSTGDPAPPEVKKFMARLVSESAALGYNMSPKVSTTEHQLENNECGMYAIHFLESLASGSKSIDDFLARKRITDNDMSELRGTFFQLRND